MTIESEYARIALELGMPGLLLWVLFFVWIATRSPGNRRDPWYLGRRVAWVGYVGYFVIATTGIGLLSAVPQSSIMLMNIGWVAAAGPRARQAAALARRRPAASSEVRLAS